MSIEIERRWKFPDLDILNKNLNAKKSEIINQIYTYGENHTVLRVRTTESVYEKDGFVTVKGPLEPDSMYSYEHEMFIGYEYAHNLIKNVRCLTKTRYTFEKLFEYVLYADVFHSPFNGIIIGEIEFKNIQDAKNFVAPDWFGEEVTDDKSYSNSNLYKKLLRLK